MSNWKVLNLGCPLSAAEAAYALGTVLDADGTRLICDTVAGTWNVSPSVSVPVSPRPARCGAGASFPTWVSEVGGKRDEQFATQLIIRGVRVGPGGLNEERNNRRVLVGNVVDAAADFEVLQRMPGDRQVEVAV